MSRDDDTRTISIGSRTASVTGAIMAVLVLATAFGGPIGGAAAYSVGGTTYNTGCHLMTAAGNPIGGSACDAVGQAYKFLSTAVNSFLGPDTSNTYAQADANATADQIAANVNTINQSMETTATIASNEVHQGSRNYAWSKGKYAAIQALNAGKNASVARKWAARNVTSYYSTIETNILTQYGESSRKINYLRQVWNNQQTLNSTSTAFAVKSFNIGVTGIANITTKLPNGDNISYAAPSYPTSGGIMALGATTGSVVGGWTPKHWSTIEAGFRGYGSASKQTHILSRTKTHNVITNISSANSQMRSNLKLWVNNTAPGYKAGQINTSQLMDPSTLVSQASTDYNSTGYYAFAGADLAAMGIPTDLNHSVSVQTTVNNQTVTWNGSFYTRWKPSSTGGKWVTGHLYNPTANNSTHMVFVATNGGIRQVTNPFTITSMTNVKTGKSVNNTTLQSHNQQTANVTMTQQQLNQLLNWYKTAHNQEVTAATGGGGGGFLSGLPSLSGNNTLIIIGIVGVGAFFLLRDAEP